jgi:hypothetical protein
MTITELLPYVGFIVSGLFAAAFILVLSEDGGKQ